MQSPRFPLSRLVFLIGALLLAGSCSGPPTDSSHDGGATDPPCSCSTGERRCQGSSVQVCEVVSGSCSSWGAAVACPTNMCVSGSCGGDCQDSCPAGVSRCTGDTSSEVCRLGTSGCLQWVSQSCAAQQYCDAAQNSCVPGVPCDGSCPADYTCKPTGVCAGGDPSMVKLDMKTVQFSGNVTLNGAAPMNAGTGCTAYPSDSKALVRFTDTTKNYSFVLTAPCSASGFAVSGAIYPGTYRVTVEGYAYNAYKYSNLPTEPYVVDTALVVTADVSGKALDIKTVQFSGNVTLNGALPMNTGTGCTAYPSDNKAFVRLTDANKNYSFVFGAPCSASGFAVSGAIYPGTYRVTVEGYAYNSYKYSNLPTVPYVIDTALVVTADVSGKALDIKTLQFSGNVTLNGAAPMNAGMGCTAYPSDNKAFVRLTDANKNYSFVFGAPCSASGFAVAGAIYPGTYRVTVEGYAYNSYKYSNLPTAPYVIDNALVVAADVNGKALDIKTLQFSGTVTLNGAAPMNAGMGCTAYPSDNKAFVRLTDANKNYSFVFGAPCSASGFAVAGAIYPGSYRVTVEGYAYNSYKYSNLPTVPYVVDTALVVTADVSGKALDIKTLQFSGNVTLNGAAPMNAGMGCTAYPSDNKAFVRLTDAVRNYSFVFGAPCSASGFAVAGAIYPGTYRITVEGYAYNAYKYSDLPAVPYVVDKALVVATDVSGKALDIKTLQFSGTITLNGVPPMNAGMGCTAYPNDSKALVRLHDATNDYSFVLTAPCSATGFAVAGSVYPGTYRVTVEGYSYNSYRYSNLPTNPYLIASRLQLP